MRPECVRNTTLYTVDQKNLVSFHFFPCTCALIIIHVPLIERGGARFDLPDWRDQRRVWMPAPGAPFTSRLHRMTCDGNIFTVPQYSNLTLINELWF